MFSLLKILVVAAIWILSICFTNT